MSGPAMHVRRLTFANMPDCMVKFWLSPVGEAGVEGGGAMVNDAGQVVLE